jgi:Domain of unknown function (DUF4874)/Domain of unknown function (DUF4832)
MQTRVLNKLIAVLFVTVLFLPVRVFAGTANYSATTNIFENPERGFNDLIFNQESFLNPVSAHPVARVNVRLDRFRNVANLDSCFLSNLSASFAAVRSAGFKVRLTFMYNFGGGSPPFNACGVNGIQDTGQDAPISIILGHIAQLSQTLNANSDVIYEIDAGFIGQFGEWHDSSYGNDSLSAHHMVIFNELAYFPSNRHITLRRPAYKMNYLNCSTCYGSTPQLGYHNQKFVDDTDIFVDPQNVYSSTACSNFYDNDVAFTANGADAASGAGLIAGDTALNRMQNYHYTIMSAYAGLITSWQNNYLSQYNTMQQKLGYRFQVTQATTPNVAIRGQTYQISATLKDNGFSKMMNQRTMVAAFNIGNSWAFSSTTLADSTGDDDLRDLRLADTNGKVYSANFTLPTSFPTGTASVYLWLPDYSASLQTSPAYSVQLDGVTWTPNLGANLLGSSLNHITVQ